MEQSSRLAWRQLPPRAAGAELAVDLSARISSADSAARRRYVADDRRARRDVELVLRFERGLRPQQVRFLRDGLAEYVARADAGYESDALLFGLARRQPAHHESRRVASVQSRVDVRPAQRRIRRGVAAGWIPRVAGREELVHQRR